MILTFFCFYLYYAVYIFYCVVFKEAFYQSDLCSNVRLSHFGSTLSVFVNFLIHNLVSNKALIFGFSHTYSKI